MARLLAASLALTVSAGCSTQQAERPAEPRTPLYENLGSHHFPITTSSADAQKYFNHAFNHGEAIRAFRQAIALDPSCAMCYWGVAFALGSNINAPITEDAAKEAWQAIGQARAQAGAATERERAYIDALARRYAPDPKAGRAPLDRAYADAMRELVERFPDDLDAATLFAQSLMDTSPWSLSGLQASLERQGRAKEAAEIKARFDDTWRRADTKVSAARPIN
jgi:hypothetical protein